MARFGERLRHLRTSHELSQMDLAKQLKTSKSSVNMYERCEREPSLEMLEKVADYFNVDLDYLLGKTDCPNKHGLSKESFGGSNVNIITIAGRDGSYAERKLSDQQLAALKAILDQMPDVPDDL